MPRMADRGVGDMGGITRQRRWRVVAAVAIVLGAVTVLPLIATPASALTPIEPDNKPTPVAGFKNGQLPASLLLQVGPTCVAHHAAAPSLSAMIGAAAANGVTLKPLECYRDLAGQQYWRDYYCARGQCQMAAVPGTSNHGWGKAADLRDQNGAMTFSSPGYAWLKLHAWRFGWNHPGWAEPGSAAAEPWHWEWVGDGGTKYPGLAYPTPMGSGIVIGGNPIGSFDGAATSAPGRITVSGWALDPDVVGPVSVHVYVDGALAGQGPADAARPDLAAAYPVYGANHGFAVGAAASTGAHEVCVFAINTGLGSVNPRLACRSIFVTGNPIGSLDGVSVDPSVSGAIVRARGWALDPDVREPVNVHGYLDGAGSSTTASLRRDDVAASFPGFGSGHGFEWTARAGHGTHDVCVYAINTGAGQNTHLACRSFRVDRNPVGSLDGVTVTRSGQATIRGWTLDPDTVAPVEAHIYVDGVRVVLPQADDQRDDVGAVHAGYGARHGFSLHLPLGHGTHQICAYGINVGAGDANAMLGCRTAVVNLDPIGTLDTVSVARDGRALVAGWALDPEVTTPVDVHVYVDGTRAAALAAGESRLDIGQAFPGMGTEHGFGVSVRVPHGTHSVCAYAINVGAGAANPLLGCRSVVVDLNPIGVLEAAQADGPATVSVAGWAVDPDALDPTTIHVYSDGVGVAILGAALPRPDVAAAFPGVGAEHGFRVRVATGPGTHRVCAFAINAAGGSTNTLLGCATVPV